MFIMTVAVPLFALLTIRASRFLKSFYQAKVSFFRGAEPLVLFYSVLYLV